MPASTLPLGVAARSRRHGEDYGPLARSASAIWNENSPQRPLGCEPALLYTFGFALDFDQRLRLCRSPRPAIKAAMRIGAPIPSTTGTPSCSLSQRGL